MITSQHPEKTAIFKFYLQFMKTKILIAFIFLINSVFSQLVTDTELWQGNTLKVELNKKLRLDIDQ